MIFLFFIHQSLLKISSIYLEDSFEGGIPLFVELSIFFDSICFSLLISILLLIASSFDICFPGISSLLIFVLDLPPSSIFIILAF